MISFHDIASISPLFILLLGALLLLVSDKSSFSLTIATLLTAIGALWAAPVTTNPLLTDWLRFDQLSYFFTLFFLLIGFGIALLTLPFLSTFHVAGEEFFFLLLSSVFGLILIGSAADFLTLFLGIETLSISLYVMCGYVKAWDFSAESAMKYFFMGSLAAATLLYGIAIVYGATGTTRLDNLTSYDSPLFFGGIGLITIALAFEAALVPFHFWAPDVYDGAPTPVAALMAVGTKVGAFAAFIRVFLPFHPLWNQGIALLAIATLIYANFVAIRQREMRRFFAYSGISHAGFLLLPLVAGDLSPLLFYLAIYALSTIGAFAVLAYLDQTSEGVSFQDVKGLFYRSPFLASLLSLCLLTLGGIPPTVGFFAKFYIFKAAFNGGFHALVLVGLLASILSAFYYLRIISLMLSPVSEMAPVERRLWPAAIVGVASFLLLFLLSWFPNLYQV